ncbi:MAG: biotin/lipoyl-binding protein, partial [Luteolibacter sp.]
MKLLLLEPFQASSELQSGFFIPHDHSMVSRIFRYLSILLALAGVVALIGINRMQAERRMPTAVEPPISPPEKAFGEAVSATGILEAWSDQVRIGSPENGLVAELFVVVNYEVKKGDPLLRLDDRDLLAQRILAESKRNVAAASVKVWAAQHEKLRSRLLRMLALNDARAVSVEELENLKHDEAVAEAQLEAARVELSAAESEVRSVDLRISKLTITAPRDGSLIQVNVRPGEQALIAAKEPLMLLGET